MTRLVVGLGGNALLRRGETADATVQLDHIRQAAPGLAQLANTGELVIVHGNGPQVGMLAIERENDSALTATYPLDALVAETQGLLGYWLQQAIGNAGLHGRIATVVTQTVVDPADPAFEAPTKFIGRVYDSAEAHRIARQHGWTVAADGANWRRVVASPAPQRIVETSIVEDLLQLGVTVICAGGAGSAVVEDEAGRRGAEAIVDKDHVAALLAITLHAERLILLTDVPDVIAGYGTRKARPLGHVTVDELAGEEFAAGSMGPKVAAACHFAEQTGRVAAIGSLDDIEAVAEGSAGTQISHAGQRLSSPARSAMTEVDSPNITPMTDEERRLIDRYWSAANYLTVAQIYLADNALLREPLRAAHIKPRLLGHWGTSPGLSLIYAHLNRLIRRTDADMLYIAGPGHGGPAMVANVYLEGSYSEVYPDISEDSDGLRRLVRQFSTPGGIPSHVGVPTPGSIHEGGELGYALVHATGAAMDNPELIVACVIGDGEAETGPLEASWKAPFFLNACRDGAVLPILHLNGYKISGPTVLGRQTDDEVMALLSAHGWAPVTVSGDDPDVVHVALAAALDAAHVDIRRIQAAARSGAAVTRSTWPAIILRTPKGWTGPNVVDGVQIEGTFRAHQVPLANVRDNPQHLELLESWLRSYHPETLFDTDGRLVPELRALPPTGDKRLGSTPHANGGRILSPLRVPALETHALTISAPGAEHFETTRPLGELLRDIYLDTAQTNNFRLFCPDETNSNRLDAVFQATDRCLVTDARSDDEHVDSDGRVMEVLSEHLCQGWLEGYLLTGRHGMFATYEAFAMVSASMTIQHAKWLQHARDLAWRAPVASLNILLTSTCWRNDHNGFSHQGPGLIDTMLSLSTKVVRIYLPPDANTLLVAADHALRSHDYVNLLVVDKQAHPQYLDLDEARRHAAAGASTWEWAGTESVASSAVDTDEPDVVLACAGDVPTEETLAAAWLLRRHVPHLRVRVVNIMDLMVLPPNDIHSHGMTDSAFEALFTKERHVIVAWHGYARAFHQLLHGRNQPGRFHVRGFTEQGTTTTPFDMVVLNRMSRYHLVMAALRRAKRIPEGADALVAHCTEMLDRHHTYVREHFEDMPEVHGWTWTDEQSPAGELPLGDHQR